MPVGPGKYDHLATHVRREAAAKGVVVIVVEGVLGSGFSVQLERDLHLRLPEVLRTMAAEIERGVYS